MHYPSLPAIAVALLGAAPAAHAAAGGIYPKGSAVIELDASNFDREVIKSNHTSLVEFYAPWCGHCQNLKPAYEKAAANLEGLVKVGAVNCDDDANKPLCGRYDVKGFPTLKTFKPSKKGKSPVVDDYNGGRDASNIVKTVVERINNHVQKVTDNDIDKFLGNDNDTAKAILFSEKGATTPLMKAVAIDFLDVITIGQVRNTQKKAVELFGVEKYPTLILLPGGSQDAVVYEGELKKPAIVKFLSQAGQPNPDPAPGKRKSFKKDKQSSKSKPNKSSATTESSDSETTVPSHHKAPVLHPDAPPVPAINRPDKLVKECLNPKGHTCVLAFVPATQGETADTALKSLADIAHKHAQGKRRLFPFFAVPSDNVGADLVKAPLELKGEVEIIAVNARRGWWRHYQGDFSTASVESWIDAIRLSEGERKKLPGGFIADYEKAQPLAEPEASSEPTPAASESATSEDVKIEVTPEAEASDANTDEASSEVTEATEPTPEPDTASEEAKTAGPHDEL